MAIVHIGGHWGCQYPGPRLNNNALNKTLPWVHGGGGCRVHETIKSLLQHSNATNSIKSTLIIILLFIYMQSPLTPKCPCA